MQEVTPQALRELASLRHVEQLTLGCSNRLLATAISDRCVAELLAFYPLRSLDLSQCVHVSDAGG